MTLQLPSTESRSEVRWMNPAAGLWVASRRGDYAGMVERLDAEYHVRSARGRALGSFPDLHAALASIDGVADDTAPAPRGLRAVLWGINGAATAVALFLALTLIR